MSNIYLYTDESSLHILSDQEQKIVLIGGDFGYGNFGDVLQHLSAIRIVNETGRYAVISVIAANAISFPGFPEWAKTVYGVDSIIYVADNPLILDEHSPKLKAVREIRNLSAVYLYGGGFLNNMWGDYVLSVVSYFLRIKPGINYVVSGQQVTAPFQGNVVKHVTEFAPKLFGVRDEISLQQLREAGMDCHFSFDDATETLIDLTKQARLQRGKGLLLHLNSSDYTANIALQRGIGYEMSILNASPSAVCGVTLFQAFRDARQDVIDSTETIKKLDTQFPFYDLRVIDLLGLIYKRKDAHTNLEIIGDFGYSCSYHVTLWLQLSGIPCWLRSSNLYYDQKARALQVVQGLEEFMKEPQLADHRNNLDRRAEWRSLLLQELSNLSEMCNICKLPNTTCGPAPWPFFFKGTPTYQEKLSDINREAYQERERADTAEQKYAEARTEIQKYAKQIDGLTSLLNQAEFNVQQQRERADAAEQIFAEAKNEIDNLSGRIEALSAQLTEVGYEAHKRRTRIDELTVQLTKVNNEVQQQRKHAKENLHRLNSTELKLADIYRSRSWRLTIPLRKLPRFMKSLPFRSR
jgi:hypothetical protein